MVEQAGLMYGATDAELRHRCRNAPEFIRANIDTRREQRGLAPLWPAIRRSSRSVAAGATRRVRLLKAFLTVHRVR